AVQPRGFLVGDEELAAIGARAGVGHGKNAGAIVLQGGIKLILELVSGATVADAKWTSALDHEVGNDAMKGDAVVEGLVLFHRSTAAFLGVVFGAFGEADEIGDGQRNLLKLQLKQNSPLR